jgi:Helicase associated domain
MTLPLRKPKRKLEGEEEAEKKSTENGETPAETAENGDSKEAAGDASDEAKPPVIKKPRRDIADAAAKAGATDTATTETETEPKEESKEGETEKTDVPPTKDTTEAKPGDETTAKTPAQDDAVKAPAEEDSDTKMKTEEAAAPAPAAKEEFAHPGAALDTARTTPAAKQTPARAASPEPATTEPVYKEEEYEEPDDGAEIPEDPEHVWNARLVDLLLYKHQYRTLHVQATYDQHLHAWVDIQRKLYRRSKKDPKSVSSITQMRLTVLDSINFPFTLRGAAHWDRYYAKLHEFNKKHGAYWIGRLYIVSLSR